MKKLMIILLAIFAISNVSAWNQYNTIRLEKKKLSSGDYCHFVVIDMRKAEKTGSTLEIYYIGRHKGSSISNASNRPIKIDKTGKITQKMYNATGATRVYGVVVVKDKKIFRRFGATLKIQKYLKKMKKIK